jgi:glycosyltransferase involved in cell wall biosynthesis
MFGQYARFASAPLSGMLDEVPVLHPRYPLIPKFGMSLAPLSLAIASAHAIRGKFCSIPDFDLIDAHYFYPDGVAAALLSRWLCKPLVITARGSDLNLIPRYRLPRQMIKWAAMEADAVITVSDALQDCLVDLGVPGSKLHTLRNGVDLDVFRPLPGRSEIRSRLCINGPCLLSVGHLIERKGHHHIIESLACLPADIELIIAGEGPWRSKLQHLARSVGVADRMRLVGSLTHEALVEYYNAADLLVLASSREGMANVLLESMACGTPVAVTNVWGAPEVVTSAAAGVLIAEQNGMAIADAISESLTKNLDRAAVRKHAEKFSWSATSIGQVEIFRSAIHEAESFTRVGR